MKRATPQPRPTNNAALVVTMLSACLALLCGAPAPVAAQQAAKTAPSVAQTNTRPLREFFAKLRQRVARGELNPNKNFAFTVTAQRKKGERFANLAFTASRGDAVSLAAAKEFLAALQQSQLLDALAQDAGRLALQLTAGDADVLIQASFTLPNAGPAAALAALYQNFFRLAARDNPTRPEALFFENTKSLAQKSEFLVVSRLPRGALNRLLAGTSAAAR
jgi:hypothetical protein